jgi:YggT family protein
VLSYLMKPGNRLMEWLIGITEPILGPVRSVIPSAAGVDFAPLAALLLLQGLQLLVHALF